MNYTKATTMLVVLVLVAMLGVHLADACTCMPAHPQDTYCRSDFAIVARVKRMSTREESRTYKIKVKKIFKAASNKTLEALQTGLLWTAAEESMCRADLDLDTTYLLTGRVVMGHARISLCSYYQPWESVTSKQRKGFRLLYRGTCNVCEVLWKSWWGEKVTAEPNECIWDTNSYPGGLDMPDCQVLHGICMKQPGGHCGWTSDRLYQECAKARKQLRREQLDREP